MSDHTEDLVTLLGEIRHALANAIMVREAASGAEAGSPDRALIDRIDAVLDRHKGAGTEPAQQEHPRHWTAEPTLGGETWSLRYDRTPDGVRNEDGTTSFTLSFPALQLTEWVKDQEQSARKLAKELNSFPPMLTALERQRTNIERWLATGEPASAEESKAIYDQICAAISRAKGRES